MEHRYSIIKSMYDIITSMNNEAAYFHWIHIVPDCATDEDFWDIAEDDTLFADAVAAFKRIFTAYKDDGLYIDRCVW